MMNVINNVLEEIKNFTVKKEINTTNREIKEVKHSGTIRIEGVDDKGQMVDVVEAVIEEIRRERRT